jgi:enoyl-CoA hydratase/carnithine racemase
MLYQTLNYQKKEKAGTISILGPVDNPAKLAQLSDELNEVCSEITWDEGVRVVILSGAEEVTFPAAEGSKEANTRAGEEQTIPFSPVAEPVAKLDQPVIVAIHGNIFGQGLELALACDIRIASEKSHFGFPHIKAGLIPGDGGTQRLSRLVGKGKALEMILLGETIDAQEAYRIDLVNSVIPSDEVMPTVTKMAQEMASKAPISLRYTKEAIVKGMDLTLEQGLHLEADLYLLIHTTRDRTEGIKAFREKKTHQFEGK